MKTCISVILLVGSLVAMGRGSPTRLPLCRRTSGPDGSGEGASLSQSPSPQSPGLCLCVGRVNENRMAFFPRFPNPICSNKRLKGKERWDPAGQGGRNNNPYPWAASKHMHPLHCAELVLRQREGKPTWVPLLKTHYSKKKKLHCSQRLVFSSFNGRICKSRLKNGKYVRGEKAIWL